MIQEAYCGFEVVKLLKEKGFDEICYRLYNTQEKELWGTDGIEFQNHHLDEESIIAPTHQLVMRWLRENYNLYVCPKLICFQGSKKCDKPYYKWEDRVLKLPTNNQVHPQFAEIHEYYNTYEEAVEAALKYTLENLI